MKTACSDIAVSGRSRVLTRRTDRFLPLQPAPPWPEFQDWQRGLTFLDGLAAFGTNAFILLEGDEPERVIGALVAGDYLSVLGVAPVLGRGFTEAERAAAARVVMLSESLWRTRFGSSAEVLGQPLRMNDDVFTIVGVMPREANVLATREDIELGLPFDPSPGRGAGSRRHALRSTSDSVHDVGRRWSSSVRRSRAATGPTPIRSASA